MEPGREFDHCPDLADSPSLARYLPSTQIEVIDTPPDDLAIQHCVFDHDGTLSTLRRGWERIMIDVMLHAVLGDVYNCTGSVEQQQLSIREKIEDYIDRSTGIQTLAQMEWLVRTARDYGLAPSHQILQASAYKQKFTMLLQEIVDARLANLANGYFHPRDFRTCNALSFLEALFSRGINLHLVSGTDEIHVRYEAQRLGYAHCFEGRITGAASNRIGDSKEQTIGRIRERYAVAGTAIAVFGDGPAEICAARAHGCYCLGFAGEEQRRPALNPSKRRRLIRAGAQVILRDYSEIQPLLSLLRIER